MDALQKATDLVKEAYYDERGMQGIMREDAAIYAAIAQAQAIQRQTEVLERIAKALESLANCVGKGKFWVAGG